MLFDGNNKHILSWVELSYLIKIVFASFNMFKWYFNVSVKNKCLRFLTTMYIMPIPQFYNKIELPIFKWQQVQAL